MVAILSTSYHALHLQISIPSPINCILEHSSFILSQPQCLSSSVTPLSIFPSSISHHHEFVQVSLILFEKKKKSSSWIYIFFWQLSFFSQNSWRNSIQCFPLLHSIHLASFQKNFTNTAFANIISNLLFVKQIRLWRLCRSTLLPIHSYSLDFRAVLLHGLLPLSLYGVLPVGSVYNLAGHSSTSSTNPF